MKTLDLDLPDQTMMASSMSKAPFWSTCWLDGTRGGVVFDILQALRWISVPWCYGGSATGVCGRIHMQDGGIFWRRGDVDSRPHKVDATVLALGDGPEEDGGRSLLECAGLVWDPVLVCGRAGASGYRC